MATTSSATAADVRKLQAEVDQLRERMDFISPMLPLVNFVQDYFQKVECEASMQLMRMKKAQVQRPPGSEDDCNAQLETAKWLHFVTDAVLTLHGNGAVPMPSRPGSAAGSASFPGRGEHRDSIDCSDPTKPALRFPPATPQEAHFSALPGGSVSVQAFGAGHGAFADSGGSMDKPHFSPGQLNVRPRNVTPVTTPQARTFTPSEQAGFSPEGRTMAPNESRLTGSSFDKEPRPSERTGSFLLRQPADGSGLQAAKGFSGADRLPEKPLNLAGARASFPGVFGGSSPSMCSASMSQDATAEPLAEPGTARDGTGGTNGSNMEAVVVDGLVLGKGSWAAAYRQASGTRRDALRLLCTSGIVTARELSDDLTVISEEHIDECVLIASEMLQTWTMDMWAQQPDEAKKFFEARLTAMYQRKFGEQKG